MGKNYLLEKKLFNILATKIESDGAEHLSPHPPFFSYAELLFFTPNSSTFFSQNNTKGWLRLEGPFGDTLAKYTTNLWKKAANY